MKLFNLFNKQSRASYKDRLAYVPTGKFNQGIMTLLEQFKGLIKKTDIRFPEKLGEEHPFDYTITEGLAKHFGIIDAIIDKHVDFIFSGGISIASEDERSKEVIEMFMKDFQFDLVARSWVRQALNKGFSPMEISTDERGAIDGLKTLQSDYVFVERSDIGVVEGYNQWTKPLKQFNNKTDSSELVPFKSNEIASLNLNVFGDSFYGQGIIWPLMMNIDQLLASRKNMHILMKRKANNPYIFLMGDKNNPDSLPTKTEMDNLGSRLEYLNNQHEWTLSAMVEPKVLDTGNITDKFQFIIENDMELLFMGAQIPSVLMGKANVSEGLANVQSRAWELRIQSLREEIEKVIEEDIFRHVLNTNGLSTHVEIIWGLPTQEEKNNSLTKMTELLKNPFLNDNLRIQLEFKIAEMFDIPEEELEEANEERKREEEDELNPKVPEGRVKKPSVKPPANDKKEHIYNHLEDITEKLDISVREWVGFNYNEYEEDVLSVTSMDPFTLLSASTAVELQAGLLGISDIEKVRFTMQEAFERNFTIREIQRNLNKRVEFKNRYRMKDGKIILNKNGNRALALSAEKRAIAIARSETIRLSNLGAIENYKKHDVKNIRWVAAMSERTCLECESLNGVVFDINNAPAPPIHTMCRCTTIPVVKG